MTGSELLDVVEVERLALKPGDILVFKCPMALSDEDFGIIVERFKEFLPGVQVLVLDNGADVSVLRADS